MRSKRHTPIIRSELVEKMKYAVPGSKDRKRGYALINVPPNSSYAIEHIPCSTDIPDGDMDTFERRFAKESPNAPLTIKAVTG
jgi:hypothetical protein